MTDETTMVREVMVAPAPAGEVEVQEMPRAPRLRRWTVAEFEAGIDSGFITEADAVELLDGLITEKMSIKPPHAFATDALADLLHENLRGKGYAIGVQNPVALGDFTRPEPDLRVARGPKRQYISRLPQPEDILWIGEVADASLRIDREFKLPLYARAGVPEYWIINIPEAQVECHTVPRADGTYDAKRTYRRGETIEHELLGEIIVAELFAD